MQKFLIDFNHINNDKLLEEIGGKKVDREESYFYQVEINSVEDLEKLQKKVWEVTENRRYMLLIDFDSPAAIYFDDKA